MTSSQMQLHMLGEPSCFEPSSKVVRAHLARQVWMAPGLMLPSRHLGNELRSTSVLARTGLRSTAQHTTLSHTGTSKKGPLVFGNSHMSPNGFRTPCPAGAKRTSQEPGPTRPSMQQDAPQHLWVACSEGVPAVSRSFAGFLCPGPYSSEGPILGSHEDTLGHSKDPDALRLPGASKGALTPRLRLLQRYGCSAVLLSMGALPGHTGLHKLCSALLVRNHRTCQPSEVPTAAMAKRMRKAAAENACGKQPRSICRHVQPVDDYAALRIVL